MPQHQVLLAQLGALERKPSSRGKEFIGHPPGGHDDVAAAVAVAAAHCGPFSKKIIWSFASDEGVWSGGEFIPAAADSRDPASYDHWQDARRRILRTGNEFYQG